MSQVQVLPGSPSKCRKRLAPSRGTTNIDRVACMDKRIILAAVAAVPFVCPLQAANLNCRVADPTGTPLNIRMQPNGAIVATARHGEKLLVFTENSVVDDKGRAWYYVALST